LTEYIAKDLEALLLLDNHHLEWSSDFESIRLPLLDLVRAYYLGKDLKPQVEALIEG